MNGGNSKSLLPLVEILISVGIFALSVILTLQIFLLAKFLGDKTSDVAMAMFEAQNVAESIKSTKTGENIDEYINTELNGGVLYYDDKWQTTDDAEKAAYSLVVTKQASEENSFGILYKFTIELSKLAPYPFIDDKKLEKDESYLPVLVSIDSAKFIAEPN